MIINLLMEADARGTRGQQRRDGSAAQSTRARLQVSLGFSLGRRPVYCIAPKACDLSKQHKLPFTKSDTMCDSCFDLVHLDIWGPIIIPSIHGHKYFLTVVDDHSRHT